MGFKLFIWITLNMHPIKYRTMEDKTVNCVGKMFDVDLNNFCAQNHPRFYVVLELGKR
jgi:hypothetical protein